MINNVIANMTGFMINNVLFQYDRFYDNLYFANMAAFFINNM